MDQDVFAAADEFTAKTDFGRGRDERVEVAPRNTLEFINDFCKRGPAAAVTGQVIENLAKKVSDIVGRVCGQFVEFVRKSIEIAASKFVVELCAMTIAAVSTAIFEKYKKSMDITSGNVFINNNGGNFQATNQNKEQQGGWGGSAFDSGWSRSSSGAW